MASRSDPVSEKVRTARVICGLDEAYLAGAGPALRGIFFPRRKKNGYKDI